MDELIQRYIYHFQKLGKRSTTLRRDRNILTALLIACPTLSQIEIDSFLFGLKEKKRKATYINIFIDVLRNINKFHPLPYIPAYFKTERFNKATMSDDEIEAFLNLPVETISQRGRNGPFIRTTDPQGHKIFTMFWKICSFTGMRPGEISHMTVDRVDFGRSVFVLYAEDTKTNTARMCPISSNIKQELEEYVKNVKGEYLFPSKNGKGVIDDKAWGYNFHKRLKRLGIKRRNLTPYSLRHSFCTRLFEEDIAFPKIMKLMGHTEPRTTLGYSHLATRDIQLAVSKLPLVRKTTDPSNIVMSMIETIQKYELHKDKRFNQLKVVQAVNQFTENLYKSLA